MQLKTKTYKRLDFILTMLKVSPVTTSAMIFNTLLSALMPAYQTLATALFVNTVFDIFNSNKNYNSIYFPLILVLAYVVYENLIGGIMDIITTINQNKMRTFFKSEVIKKRSRLDYKHIENNETWELINRAASNPETNFYDGFNNILAIGRLIISVISLLTIVTVQIWWGGLAILAISVPLFFIAKKAGKENYEKNKEAQKIKRRNDYLRDLLIKREYSDERANFRYTNSVNNKFQLEFKKMYKINRGAELDRFVKMKLSGVIILAICLLIIIVLLEPLHSGVLSIGLFIGLTTTITGLVNSMTWEINWATSELTRLGEYLKDFTEFMKLSEKPNANALPAKMNGVEFKDIEFRNVTFKYPDTERYILKDCSFVLNSDMHYAFVGVNGAGKTTITKLLTGMYDNYEGDIFINSKNIKEYDFAELKALISVVYQDFAKYQIKFKENIYLGNVLQEDEQKMSEIITEVGLDDTLIKLKDGKENYLGKIIESGQDISGGEWQRVAISRLLYSDAKINILDEPTAALDPIAESQVYEMFNSIAKDRFTIYITHRLGAAKIADKILVIDNGAVAESGSHNELMEQSGIYAEMFNSQKRWYEQWVKNLIS